MYKMLPREIFQISSMEMPHTREIETIYIYNDLDFYSLTPVWRSSYKIKTNYL
jgi:hypothetical protein